MCTTVDEYVDNCMVEHVFDGLIWGFPFHTVCGEPGFNYTLKVGPGGVSTV